VLKTLGIFAIIQAATTFDFPAIAPAPSFHKEAAMVTAIFEVCLVCHLQCNPKCALRETFS